MHQQALVAVFPGTVSINGVKFDVALSTGAWEPKLLDDGINYRVGRDATFSVAKESLPDAPAPRTAVIIGAEEYRVVSVDGDDEYEPAWHITARRFA